MEVQHAAGIAGAVLWSAGLHCMLHAECPVAVIPPVGQTVEEKAKTSGKDAIAGAGLGYGSLGPLY